MRILFPTGPGYGLMLPLVPLVWAARAAGHEVLLATTAYVVGVSATQCGLPTVDVFPSRDVGADLILAAGGRVPEGADADPGLPPGYWATARELKPFELFTLAMIDGTITAGREFRADLVMYPADHPAGLLAATALGIPAVEVGNRISWSLRDQDLHRLEPLNDRLGVLAEDAPVIRGIRDRLGLGDRRAELIARIDPRPIGLGGLDADRCDGSDGVPWWPMRYVPYNGGGVVPDWLRSRPGMPRVCLTLGTVTPLLSDGSLLRLVLDVLAGFDVEVVLADHSTDVSRLGPLPPNIRHVGYLPLSTILDTSSLAVHHGGSGTTAAALHFGVPQLLLPEGADNPLVAERVVKAGAGLAVPPAEADEGTLSHAVHRLLDEPAFAAAAAGIGAEMAAQPSPARVLERICEQVALR